MSPAASPPRAALHPTAKVRGDHSRRRSRPQTLSMLPPPKAPATVHATSSLPSDRCGPEQVLAYLARYTHRVAISNRRLVAVDETHVRFRWKDYRENGGSRSNVMRLAAGQFMRQFLLHVLPDGFHRIRHYGLFANGHRAEKLALCRKLLKVAPTVNEEQGHDGDHNDDPPPCPCCGGRMKIIETFERGQMPRTISTRGTIRRDRYQPTFTQMGRATTSVPYRRCRFARSDHHRRASWHAATFTSIATTKNLARATISSLIRHPARIRLGEHCRAP